MNDLYWKFTGAVMFALAIFAVMLALPALIFVGVFAKLTDYIDPWFRTEKEPSRYTEAGVE